MNRDKELPSNDDDDDNHPNESIPLFKNNDENVKIIKNESNEHAKNAKHLSVHYQVDQDNKDSNEQQPQTPDQDDGNGTLRSNSAYGTHYDTKNLKSFKNYTREALPRMEFYRNLMSIVRFHGHGHGNRPTLDELHGNQTSISLDNSNEKGMNFPVSPADNFDPSKVVKFGWIKGVLVRNLLNIWGVILFLRLSWVGGQTGLIYGILIILLASLCTTLTAMSMSAICTNGEVKGGGTYYMISRSLGPEFGGAIGIIFSLANAVAVAMYTVGFAETFRDVVWPEDESINTVRIISCITVVVLLAIVFIGTAWEAKAQVFLLIILVTAMLDFIAGSILGPVNDQQIARGYFGWNTEILKQNMMPDYRNGNNFFSLFAVYFPAATGILAGANISGDLKDPSKAIPKGTFLAIGITTITYIAFHFIVNANVVRDANGLVELIISDNQTGRLLPNVLEAVQNCPNTSCSYGLVNYYQIVEMMSMFGPVIYAGIFAAALSSALASLVSAPKVFQALCNDRLFPYISFFGKGYGPNNEPRPGYLLAFAIAMCCCLLGELNLIAPIISNFFLAAYTLINFSCFHASFSRSPGFRPSFRYYNQWLSLISAILMTLVMFITSWSTALLTFLIILVLYMWILYRKPDVNWGSSTQAQTYRSALTSVHRLNAVPEHVKNYRPQILFLSGHPKHRPDHVDIAHLIIKNSGLLICGNVVIEPISVRTQFKLQNDSNQWLMQQNIKAFVDIMQENDFHKGSRALIQLSGIGKLRPNIIMLGFKTDWNNCESKCLLDYFNTIHTIFDYHLSIVIFRHNQSIQQQNGNDNDKTTNLDDPLTDDMNSSSTNVDSENPKLEISNPKTRLFLTKQPKGSCIDVWWLYDDGGLTLLLPYLIRSNPQWNGCKLRVFALANKQSELDIEQRNMATLLSKFRIDFSSVTLITDILKPPKEESKIEFDNLIEKYLQKDDEQENECKDFLITNDDLEQFKEKNNRNIRLRELLLQHSKDARLIVMTLPMPRKDTCPPSLYMAWLDTLTRDMPPIMLMRGNQTNVLTFYS
ncbi:hypothetical protein DERP_011798 [Dermatophagoides pteronyssinus]|uniref:Solute carrier family 12 member 2-like n=1 Tax=Dermatophagoides pteronyssinus TaxID=6956 RepID=A0ABQ8JRL2_DERPT|nr:hypothetical protein DERP_011798 [Dermatophagoides pteronyssinus]